MERKSDYGNSAAGVTYDGISDLLDYLVECYFAPRLYVRTCWGG